MPGIFENGSNRETVKIKRRIIHLILLDTLPVLSAPGQIQTVDTRIGKLEFTHDFATAIRRSKRLSSTPPTCAEG